MSGLLERASEAPEVSRPTSPPTLTTSVPASIPLGVVPSQRVILTVQQSWIAVKERDAKFLKDLGIANVGALVRQPTGWLAGWSQCCMAGSGELLYKHMFRIAPVTKELFPVSVRMRYRDWTSSAQEVGSPRAMNDFNGEARLAFDD
eukprot:Skav211490  [mRNA]  locus=scaffold2188:458696:461178:+ [translate_table: standard]